MTDIDLSIGKAMLRQAAYVTVISAEDHRELGSIPASILLEALQQPTKAAHVGDGWVWNQHMQRWVTYVQIRSNAWALRTKTMDELTAFYGEEAVKFFQEGL